MTFCQRRHFYRIIGDKCGLYVPAFATLAENLVDQFAFAHRGVDLDTEFAAYSAQGIFVHAGDVETGVFLDCLSHSDTRERSFEAYSVVADAYVGGAVYVKTYFFEHAFGESHHPVVVLVGHVNLHASELGVVGAVHAFVAEVLGELVNAVEASDNQALQIKLVGNTQV